MLVHVPYDGRNALERLSLCYVIIIAVVANSVVVYDEATSYVNVLNGSAQTTKSGSADS